MDDDLWYTEPRKLLEGAYFPSPEGPYNPDTGCTGCLPPPTDGRSAAPPTRG